VVVLVLGGLFVRSLDNARQAFRPGFDADRLLSLRLDPGLLAYRAPRIEALYRDLLRQLSDVPRVESASLVGPPPLGGFGSASAIVVPDSSRGGAGGDNGTELHHAGPRYFQTMGIPLVAGRDFAERDTNRSTLVAILSEAEARRLFGSAQNAVGKRIQSAEDGAKALRLGVVNDKSRSGLDDARVLYALDAASACRRNDPRRESVVARRSRFPEGCRAAHRAAG
jgi:hypothetical protein